MTLSGTDFTSAARQLAVKRRTSQESGGFFFAQVEYGDPLGWFPLARHKVTWYGARRRHSREAASCCTYLINDFKQLYFKCPVSGMARNCSRVSEACSAEAAQSGGGGSAAYTAWTAVLTIHIQLHRRQKGPQVAVVTAARPLHNFSPPLCTTICTTSTWTSSYPRLYLPGHALPTTER